MLSPERSETKACICNQNALRADSLTAAITVINSFYVKWKPVMKTEKCLFFVSNNVSLLSPSLLLLIATGS